VILYLFPATALLAGVFIFPLAGSFTMSLQNNAGLAGTEGWAGLDNYVRIVQSKVFWDVTGQTFVWTFGVLFITMVVSIGLALLLRRPFPGRSLVRVLLMLPWAAALSVSAVVWSFGLRETGLINETLREWGFGQFAQQWLAQPPVSTATLILIGAWASIPFTVLMISAGMRSIPAEIFEAVSLETSNPFVRDWFFTIPLAKRTIQITAMSNAIVIFNSFPLINVLTGGGPSNKTHILATYLYSEAFRSQRFADASAIAVLVSLALIVLAVIYARQILGAPEKLSAKAVKL
jgi:multiple sugar transport system permease protein